MKLLAIESSGLVASAAILEDDILVAEYTTDFKKTHSQTLLPMIDELTRMTEQDLDTIDAIAVSKGPGSFTGLRIGAATAKGLALALKKPLIQIPTVDAIAYNLYETADLICPIMDARRNQVYTGLYEWSEGSFQVVEPQMAVSIDEIIEKIRGHQRRVIFLGDGVPVYSDRIREALSGNAMFAPPHLARQRAGALAVLAAEYYRAGKVIRSTEFQPEYLRLSQAERERLAKEELKITIRRMTEKDLDAVVNIEQETMQNPWSKQSFLDSLALSHTCFLVAEMDDQTIVGYCGSYFSTEEAELPLICVKKEFQRRGIADKLLHRLYEEMKQAGISRLFLEVRKSNKKARKLYEKQGFSYLGTRPGFYTSPKEDALSMRLERIPIE